MFLLQGYPTWHKMYGKPKPRPKNLTTPTANSVSKAPMSNSQPQTADLHSSGQVEHIKTTCGISEDQYQHVTTDRKSVV